MSIEQTKSKVVASIWQSIAQSGIQVSSLPQDQLEALVNAIADGVLVAVDETLEATGMPSRQATATMPLDDEEQILWEGRPFLSLVTHYQITSQRVRIVTGLLGKDRDDIELIRVQDIDITQGVNERVLNIGDIHIVSHDPSLPETVLRNVRDPMLVHETLRRAMLDARKRYRYTIQEEM